MRLFLALRFLLGANTGWTNRLFQDMIVEAWMMMLFKGKGTKIKSCVFAVVVTIRYSIIMVITVYNISSRMNM